MNIERIKEMLKNKKVIVASSAVISLVVIGAIAVGIVHNKNKVEDNKQIIEITKEDNSKEKEVKDKLEELKKIDISKLSEEDRKRLENKIVEIEMLIENKEYAKATTDIKSLKNDIDVNIEEVAKNEETKEEDKDAKAEANKEVASNTSESSTNYSNDKKESNMSSNTSSTTSSSGNTSSNQEVAQKPTTPPVVEGKPVQQPIETPEPTPQPPVVEEPKPVYPSVAEVKQRLIAYGQSLGYTYNSALEGSGFNAGGTSQMKGSENGNSTDGQRLFNGLDSLMVDNEFGITVVDLGNGYVEMSVWIR